MKSNILREKRSKCKPNCFDNEIKFYQITQSKWSRKDTFKEFSL